MFSLLIGTHIFFTFRLKFIQKNIFKGIGLSVRPSKSNEGETSSFGLLATTLAATLGTGNIIGVSTAVSLAAFTQIPYIGETLLGTSIILFALATLVGWSYFGEKAVEYLFGKDGINTYHLCYIVMIYIGGILPLSFVWELTDFLNAFMVASNLIPLWFLYKKIKA